MEFIISTSNAPAAIGPYSQGILVTSGKTIYISGQLPIDIKTGEFAAADIATQTKQSILNLKAILNKAGGDLSHIVKTTVFLKNMTEFALMNQVYSEFFTENFPARSTIEVAALPKGAKVEIEAIAVI